MTVKREGGQAVVEFALISLVLMMLTVGLVDLGRGFFQYQAVASAARFGARWVQPTQPQRWCFLGSAGKQTTPGSATTPATQKAMPKLCRQPKGLLHGK